jgi:hypothetical protein
MRTRLHRLRIHDMIRGVLTAQAVRSRSNRLAFVQTL